jgi:hypothetical protein
MIKARITIVESIELVDKLFSKNCLNLYIQWWHDRANFGLYVIFDGKKRTPLPPLPPLLLQIKPKKWPLRQQHYGHGGGGKRVGWVGYSPTKVMVIYLS